MRDLTARQIEVLQRCANGERLPTIAQGLHISPNTARTHRDDILRRLGVHSMTAAVAAAMRQGLIR